MKFFPVYLLPLFLLPACTRISGTVEQAPGVPLTTAVLSIGRPDGIAVNEPHHVDSKGHYDFLVGPTDETNVYIYDGANDPLLTLRRLEQNEIRKNAVIRLRPANPNSDLSPGME